MKRPAWKIRRRIIFGTLFFCAFCVLWIMIRGTGRSVEEVIVMCSFGLAASVIGAYVFGAVWDDSNVMRHMGRDAYDDPVPPSIDGPQE
jgi:hypothetical protein